MVMDGAKVATRQDLRGSSLKAMYRFKWVRAIPRSKAARQVIPPRLTLTMVLSIPSPLRKLQTAFYRMVLVGPLL